MGAGSVRAAPPVLATLAGYFGERELDIALYDADEERVDLADRLARALFLATKATHRLSAGTDAAQALAGADHVVFCLGENCALKFLGLRRMPAHADLELPLELDPLAPASVRRTRPSAPVGEVTDATREALIRRATDRLMVLPGQSASVLWLVRGVSAPADRRVRALEWPSELSSEERAAMPHRILRWIRGDEKLSDLLDPYRDSPLKDWLEARDSN